MPVGWESPFPEREHSWGCMWVWLLGGQLDKSAGGSESRAADSLGPLGAWSWPERWKLGFLVTGEHVTPAQALLLPHKPPSKNLSHFTRTRTFRVELDSPLSYRSLRPPSRTGHPLSQWTSALVPYGTENSFNVCYQAVKTARSTITI